MTPKSLVLCHAGAVLSQFSSQDEIIQPTTSLGLVGLALLVAFLNYLAKKYSGKVKV